MATKFIESGTDATQGFEFWDSTSGTVTSDTAQFNTGPRSIKCTNATGSFCRKTGVLADAGTRVSAYFRFTNFSNSGFATDILFFSNAIAFGCFELQVTSAGVLQLNQTGGQIGSDGSTLSLNTWYRISVAYTITSSTVNEFRVYLDGVLDITVSNVSLIRTGTDTIDVGQQGGSGATAVIHFDDVYIDDSSALTDTGDIHVTAKLPNAENVNNFDTAIGTSRSTTDYNNVNERPLSETNGWRHNATTAVNENYGIQNASTGDVDISSATLVARTAWLWGKRDSVGGPIAFVTSASNQSKSGGTTLSITVPSGGWAAGSSVILTFACDDATGTFSVADTAGNTYAEDTSSTNSGNVITKVFSSHNISALSAGNTVTVTHPSLDARALIGANFTGLATSSVKDLSLTATGSSGTPQVNNTTTTTTQADELIIGAYGGEGPNGDVWGDPTTLSDENIIAQNGTTGGGAAGNITAFMLYRIVSSTAQWDTDASIDNSRDWAACLTSYKALATAGTPKITNNGTDTAITLTTSSALYTNIVDSASYPSNAATIGMVSGGGSFNTYLYECGMLFAYIPAAGTAIKDIIGNGIIPFPR